MRLTALFLMAITLAACGDGQAAQSAGTQQGPTERPGATPSAPQPGERTFRDWYVVCNNANACYAFGHATEGTAWVRVAMPAGPDGKPDIVLGFWPENGAFSGAVTAQVAGTGVVAATDPVGDDDDYPVALVRAPQVEALIATMTQGEAMTLKAGGETVSISLSGAAASLLWIDERQGRLGTTTALIRKGDRPPSTVPSAPALPVVNPAAAVAQGRYGDQEGQALPTTIEELPDVVQCRADTDFNPDLQAAIVSARLDADTVLWGVPCGAGAYNFSNAYFTTRPDGSNPRRLTFPSTGEPLDLLVNASYDPVTRVIDAFDKGRGLGDCGTASSWTWTDRGFVLKTSSGMSDCNGVPSEYWPTFWVTR
ncbi:DUF1176 domain-containing protein [Brevundimonas subvibrioides]|uniref:DUF1176 domain-containing protein n=1 Tax=Brevundimonas subvibrioides TaxID=74313 RepID=UPI0022B3237E|nr:DUF1176 domain-containing protein [Brevundimonas subvibrioides]